MEFTVTLSDIKENNWINEFFEKLKVMSKSRQGCCHYNY